MLLDKDQKVVGVMAVSPERNNSYRHTASAVVFNNIELCSPKLGVKNFSYINQPVSNILNWENFQVKPFYIMQDEGMLKLNAQSIKQLDYARMYKVSFSAFDVFSLQEEFSEETQNHPDFEDEWGLPKGKGVFYFYLPANWKK